MKKILVPLSLPMLVLLYLTSSFSVNAGVIDPINSKSVKYEAVDDPITPKINKRNVIDDPINPK
jgi:hypothetical protein